ncbi:glycosyltransferase family 4 protein [Bacillus sp. FJAT-26390]|uniref:glycosyltransferase family 4 protein n=1 Tax=Bacillus sp. FJAT-26390 TaxID=1743142 RepID=UPI000807A332|nr:glycosyltransferase family 4 protein [Bacillus sp. FJAT-26390]OBZ11230.1 glycosyltransferase WbuB [Bacillus sp. FJAT-26390]
MKILFVCQYFYPEQFRVNDICFQLVKDGHEVTVLTGLPNYPGGVVNKKYRWFRNQSETINGVKVIRSWLLGRGNGKVRLGLNYLSFAVVSSIRSLFIKKDFDNILVYQLSPVTMALPGLLLKKMTKKPLILYCHDLWPESIASAGISDKSRLYRGLLKLSRWIYKSADEIWISSRLFKEYFVSKLDINNNITYLPVYAEGLFEEIDIEKATNDTINLVFAGNIGEMQSVETIINAANELKEINSIKWHIVGDGSSRRKCEELAQRLELENVVFHGHHPISAMPEFYQMADAFLVTLKANKVISYTLPNKVQSYMAASKPIIGAIDGETKLVIEESGCGYCSAAEDYKMLAENIRVFISEKDKHIEYGERAKKYYDINFSKGVYMSRLYGLLQKINKSEDVHDV